MLATLASGCFWCTEAIFKKLKGVTSTTSGYSGNPEAESIQINFDPSIIPYEKILEVFFATHDPTTPNRQGNDIGPQYRSMIFYHDEDQKNIAEKFIKPPIITETVPFTAFYPAGDHHQNFYEKNPHSPYCTLVIDPKIKKFLNRFPTLVK